ncbi:FAD-binding protein, partial [Verminephrobacter sp. Larva24]
MNAQHKITSLLDQLNTVIVGKRAQVQDCVACLLAGGHLLIEDMPGVGKTTLAHALSHTFGLQFSRVQFTADLMPSDLTGVSVYERGKQAFVFHPGPVFAQVLLADEINRASPRTQSALLEAMEEKQVSVEGETRALPQPFFVIATQNPNDQLGTFALPESQLDRFLMRISLGYPDRTAERILLAGTDRRDLVTRLLPLLSGQELLELQRQVQAVHTAGPLLDYVQDLVAATRSGRWFLQGLSPRAGIALLRAAKAQALISGRDYVAPDDVQAIVPQTIAHRLVPVGDAGRGVVEQVRAAVADRTPLRIRGGGSKDFHGLALHGQLLDTRMLRGIVSYAPSELVVTVRAGTPLAELEAALAEQGQCLPFEPPHFARGATDSATVGGMVAAGLSGPARARAGA